MGYIFLVQPEHTSIMPRTQTPWADGVIAGTNFWKLPAHPGVDIPKDAVGLGPCRELQQAQPLAEDQGNPGLSAASASPPRGSPHAPAMGLLSISPRTGQAAEISLAFQHESPSQTL